MYLREPTSKGRAEKEGEEKGREKKREGKGRGGDEMEGWPPIGESGPPVLTPSVHTCELDILLTGDGLHTANALLGELLREAVGTERLLIARSKLLSDQHLVAPGACETFAMPWRALVRYSALVDHLRSGKQLRIKGGSIYRKYRDCRRYR